MKTFKNVSSIIITSIFFMFLFSCQKESTDDNNTVSDNTETNVDSDSVEVLRNVPIYKDKVTDYSGIFTEEENAELIAICNNFEKNTPFSAFILAVPNLGDEGIDEYSLKIAKAWQAAEELQTEDGLIIIIASGTGNLKFQVGDDMKNSIKEEVFQQIISNNIAPNFPSGKYFDGLKGALLEIEKELIVE